MAYRNLRILIMIIFGFIACSLFSKDQGIFQFDRRSGDIRIQYRGQFVLSGVVKMKSGERISAIDFDKDHVLYQEAANQWDHGSLVQSIEISGSDSIMLLFDGACVGMQTFSCRPDSQSGNILRTVSGYSDNGLNNGIYCRKQDWALLFDGSDEVSIVPAADQSFQISVTGQKINLYFKPDYYKRHLGRPYYNPEEFDIRQETIAGWISWKAYGPYLTEDQVKGTVDWCAEKFRPFGLNYIIIDDGWFIGSKGMLHQVPKNVDWTMGNERFPSGMASLANYIHSKGFKAGIWLSPFGISSDSIMSLHPDWWVRQAPDSAYTKSRSNWHGPYFVDGSNPEAVKGYLLPGIQAMLKDGYDFFKLDGQMHAAHEAYASSEAYFEGKGLTWQQAYRMGWKSIMEMTEGKFVLSCWSRIPENIGNPHAIRIGGDKDGGWDRGPMPAARDLSKYLCEHNICWKDDPDHLVLSKSDEASARSWVTLVGLTGTLLTFSDMPENLSDEKIEMLRRILPPVEVMPLELYELDQPPALWTMEISRPYDRWLIVANTSFDEKPRSFIEFQELGLSPEKEYTVYSYWDQKYLGTFTKSFSCPPVAEHDAAVYCIHEKRNYPWIVSVNRHISQGGISLMDLKFNTRKNRLSGISKIVGNDPYKISISNPQNANIQKISVDEGEISLESNQSGLIDMVIKTNKNGTVHWAVTFDNIE